MAHRLITATYQLYTVENGEEVLKEQIPEEQPLTVYTELGMLLPAFETRLAEFEAGNDYEFTLTKGDAYGEYDANAVVTLGREVFSPDGVFDDAHVHVGAVVPLQNDKGERFLGHVINVDDTNVTVDLNHPLAGKDLHFKGRVIENRPASDEEVNDFVEKSKQHHCGGHCGGDCGGGCGEGDCHCGDGDDCHCGGDDCHCGGEGGCGCHEAN